MTAMPPALVAAAAALWKTGEAPLEHLGDSGNSVYRVGGDGEERYLRLTDPAYRTLADTAAELDFIDHLAKAGVRVSVPLRSARGNVLEIVDGEGGRALAVMFDAAPGALVTRGDAAWGESFFRAWGFALGAIHRAATTFRSRPEARRWHWRDEHLFVRAEALLPAGDAEIRAEVARIPAPFADMPMTDATYGMTHADFGPQNFRYDPHRGVTAFDFGNACYHWFASDLAVALSVIRRAPREERARERAWLEAGYGEVFPLPPRFDEELAAFLRLRVLYVYLDRLERFGTSDAREHRELLAELRARVMSRPTWES